MPVKPNPKKILDDALQQDALRAALAIRLKDELCGIQDYWSRKAKEKGVYTEGDLMHFLGKILPGEKI